MDLHIKHDQANKQFTTTVDGETGYLSYSVSADGKTLDYKSTLVPPELRGQHIGEKIVKYALDYANKNHLQVIPTCPFVRRVIEKHPEYQHLIKS